MLGPDWLQPLGLPGSCNRPSPVWLPAYDHGGFRIAQGVSNLGLISVAAEDDVIPLTHVVDRDNVGVSITTLDAKPRNAACGEKATYRRG